MDDKEKNAEVAKAIKLPDLASYMQVVIKQLEIDKKWSAVHTRRYRAQPVLQKPEDSCTHSRSGCRRTAESCCHRFASPCGCRRFSDTASQVFPPCFSPKGLDNMGILCPLS